MEKSLYQRAKKGARAVALGGLAALSLAGCSKPKLELVKDINGDSISDIQIFIPNGTNNGRYIFLSDTTGHYLTLSQTTSHPAEFVAGDGTIYFIDSQSGGIHKAKLVFEK